MMTILKLVLAGIPAVFAKFFVALAGPTIRGLGILRGDELSVLLGHVAALYKGQVPTYGPLGKYLDWEVQDMSEALHNTLQFLFAGYKVTLTDNEVNIAVAAISARLLEKYPAPAV